LIAVKAAWPAGCFKNISHSTRPGRASHPGRLFHASKGSTPMAAGKDFDISNALLDPSSQYRSPQDVVGDGRLTLDQKIEVLRRWEYDEAEVRVAEEEGMPGGNNGELLQQIVQALNGLAGSVDVEHTPPTKQGGIPRPTRS